MFQQNIQIDVIMSILNEPLAQLSPNRLKQPKSFALKVHVEKHNWDHSPFSTTKHRYNSSFPYITMVPNNMSSL